MCFDCFIVIQAEALARKMIEGGQMEGTIDQAEGVIEFEDRKLIDICCVLCFVFCVLLWNSPDSIPTFVVGINRDPNHRPTAAMLQNRSEPMVFHVHCQYATMQ